MAQKEEKLKVVLERNYNVPLRRHFMMAQNWRKAKKAVAALKVFIEKHMKSEDVKIGKWLNLHIWERGIKNPPHHVKVKALKYDSGRVFVELAELPRAAQIEKKMLDKKKKDIEEKKKKQEKKEEPKKTEAEKELEHKVEEAKEEKAEEAIEIQKEEIKEIQKEHPRLRKTKDLKQKKVDSKPTAPQSQ